MSIVVNIYYSGKNQSARRFAEEMTASGTVNGIRAQEGNLAYQYYFPVDDEETVLLIDSWQDQAALDRHHSSPYMETILRLREKYDLLVRAVRYVSDDDGFTENDKRFIKS